MIILLLFAFISGLFTILAPCIWPLLPIVLSASATSDSRQRPLGITLGVMLSFGFFTLTLSSLAQLLHIDPGAFRWLAVVVLVFFGFSLLLPSLNFHVEGFFSRLSGRIGQRTVQGSGFGQGLATGLSLGLVWSPCAGPILATIAALAATRNLSSQLILVTFVYVLGIGLPLFGFAYGGQQLLARSRKLTAHTGQLQKLFGVLTLIVAVAIAFNYDKVAENGLLNLVPQYTDALNSFESNPAVQQQLDTLKGHKSTVPQNSDLLNVQTVQYAPEFKDISHWLNSSPLTMSSLKGKVVLVDFWTYTCINCIRTLPYITHWYDTYKDQGFVVVGVHTPEFAFEKDAHNVAQAIQRYGINYPVAQDNDYGTWNAFGNNYWPAEYLIDATGRIRRVEYGEGGYDKMEQAIQLLLRQNGQTITETVTSTNTTTPTEPTSPETYFGSDRMEYYDNLSQLGSGSYHLNLESSPDQNTFSLGGAWDISGPAATAEQGAVMNYHFEGEHVYAVLRPGQSSEKVQVLLDGQEIMATQAGADVDNGVVKVTTDRLYDLVNLHGKAGSHILQLKVGQGIQLFTLTFG